MAYKKSQKSHLDIISFPYFLYGIKYVTGIDGIDLLSLHHAIWLFCVVFLALLTTSASKRIQSLLLFVIVVVAVKLFLPKQITMHISLYGMMWLLGATAFLVQKTILIRKKSFVGLSFVSMTGFGLMHVCAAAFFLEKGDLLTVASHTVYILGHIVLLYYMMKYKK